MRIPRIAQAMTDIDDDLITGAMEYRRDSTIQKFFCSPILRACACIVLSVFIFGTSIWVKHNNSEIESPFILTAYAYSTEDNQVSTDKLRIGQKIPVSLFETEDGVQGFLISYNKKDKEESSFSIVIISNDEEAPLHAERIRGVELDATQNYYFFVPAKDETEPFNFPMFLTDREKNLACYYELSISEDGGDYYAEITDQNISKRVTE